MLYEKIKKNRYKINVNAGSLIVEQKAGKFHIIDEDITKKKGNPTHDYTELGFSEWYDDAKPLDKNSDAMQCFEISQMIKIKKVIIDLNKKTINVKTIEELCDVLDNVSFCAWCPGGI